jgi:16S rRNA (guanine527-N7)-methyltransferase
MAPDRAGDWKAVARFASSLGVELPAEARSRIDRFLELLVEWNVRLRLTGERDPSVLLTKHVADSIACIPLLPRGAAMLDLGTGAGFPGVVIACVRRDLPVTLLDSRARSTTFVGEVVRALGLDGTRVALMRAEDAALDPQLAHRQRIVVSRAVRMEIVFRLAAPMLEPTGICIAMQSGRVSAETVAQTITQAGFEPAAILAYELPTSDPRRLVVARKP